MESIWRALGGGDVEVHAVKVQGNGVEMENEVRAEHPVDTGIISHLDRKNIRILLDETAVTGFKRQFLNPVGDDLTAAAHTENHRGFSLIN